jgi:hypothetical protein
MRTYAFGFLALTAITLAGCSDQAVTTSRQESRCELMVEEVCARAMQALMLDGIREATALSKPPEARMEPFVIPIFLADGRPAAMLTVT